MVTSEDLLNEGRKTNSIMVVVEGEQYHLDDTMEDAYQLLESIAPIYQNEPVEFDEMVSQTLKDYTADQVSKGKARPVNTLSEAGEGQESQTICGTLKRRLLRENCESRKKMLPQAGVLHAVVEKVNGENRIGVHELFNDRDPVDYWDHMKMAEDYYADGETALGQYHRDLALQMVDTRTAMVAACARNYSWFPFHCSRGNQYDRRDRLISRETDEVAEASVASV